VEPTRGVGVEDGDDDDGEASRVRGSFRDDDVDAVRDVSCADAHADKTIPQGHTYKFSRHEHVHPSAAWQLVLHRKRTVHIHHHQHPPHQSPQRSAKTS
jgi:hypothetical protein